MGAGDEVVEAAAVVAENEAPVGEMKSGTEEERADDGQEAEDDAGESDEGFAEEPGVEEARFGAVDTGDADFGDDLADGLAAGAEKNDLNDEKDEPADEGDESAESETGHVVLCGIGFDALHARADDFGEFRAEDEEAWEAEEDFESPVDEAGEEARAAFGEFDGFDRGGGGGDG